MKKYLISLFICLYISYTGSKAAPNPVEIEVTLLLEQQKIAALNNDPPKEIKDPPKEQIKTPPTFLKQEILDPFAENNKLAALDYITARKQAIKEDKKLVVWVAPYPKESFMLLQKQMPEFIHCNVEHFIGTSFRYGVVVFIPKDKGLTRASDIPASEVTEARIRQTQLENTFVKTYNSLTPAQQEEYNKKCLERYYKKRDQAIKEDKKLVVWVYCTNNKIIEETPECIHCYIPEFPGIEKEESGVVIGIPQNGDLIRVIDIFYENITTEKIKAAKISKPTTDAPANPTNIYLAPNPAPQYYPGNFNSGGFRGGACRG